MVDVLASTKAVGGSLGITAEMRPGLAELDKLLRKIGEGFGDWRGAWRRIALEVLLPSIDAAFSARASQDGDAWAPHSPDYAKRKKGGALLEDTGALRKSLTKKGGGGGAMRRYNKKWARIGTDLPYALPLQWGYGAGSHSSRRSAARASQGVTTKPRKSRSKGARSDVPARRFIAWSRGMREQAILRTIAHLDQVIADQVAKFPQPAGVK